MLLRAFLFPPLIKVSDPSPVCSHHLPTSISLYALQGLYEANGAAFGPGGGGEELAITGCGQRSGHITVSWKRRWDDTGIISSERVNLLPRSNPDS